MNTLVKMLPKQVQQATWQVQAVVLSNIVFLAVIVLEQLRGRMAPLGLFDYFMLAIIWGIGLSVIWGITSKNNRSAFGNVIGSFLVVFMSILPAGFAILTVFMDSPLQEQFGNYI